MCMTPRKFNIIEIQKDLDRNLSRPEICKKHPIGLSTIADLLSKGELKRTQPPHKNHYHDGVMMSMETKEKLKKLGTGKKHSEATKKKISEIRIAYLTAHPDKVPYLINHSSKQSYPEKLFQTALESSKIDGWIFEYQNGIYQYDFAFPQIKLDIEIDGGTHLTDKVKKIDERRDIWSKSQGWTVLRFTAKEVKTDIIKCIDKVKEFLHGL